MTFNEVLSQTIAMLHQHGRVSYRALKRQTAALVTGCIAYPGCACTEPPDPRVQALGTGVDRAVQVLATQVAQMQTEAQHFRQH